MSELQKVLVFGATGNTGSVITEELLASKNFKVAIANRSESQGKPLVTKFRSQGAEVLTVDLSSDDNAALTQAMQGVDIVVSAIRWDQLQYQKKMADIAKDAGVSRFVPCDFGTACIPGIRSMFDEKLGIQDYIKKKGLGYTFIDVSWWTQIVFPYDVGKGPSSISEWTRYFYGKGDVKTAVLDNRDIGLYVAHILADPRTLNRYVFCWSEEVTQRQVFDLADRINGKQIPRRPIDAAEVKDIIKKAKDIANQEAEKANFKPNGSSRYVTLFQDWFEYYYSLYIRGDNIVENALKPEYGNALDGKELYPNLQLRSVTEFAKKFYNSV